MELSSSSSILKENRCPCYTKKDPSPAQLVLTLTCDHCGYLSCIRHRYHDCKPKKEEERAILSTMKKVIPTKLDPL
ncbi:hypothetical protein EBS02_09055 [bacterium]|nr:hypothetical protein [bacterium]